MRLNIYDTFGGDLVTYFNVIEADIDPLALTSVNFWKREARTAKLKIVKNNFFVESILKNPLRFRYCNKRTKYLRYRCQLVEDDEILFSGMMDTSNIKMNFKSAFVELKLTDVLGVMTENDESLELEDDEPIIKTIEELIEVLLRKLINIGSSDFEGDEIGTSIDYPDIPLLEDSVYDLLTVDWDSWLPPNETWGEGDLYYSLSETSVDTIQLEIFKVWFNDNLGVAYVRRETYEIYPTTYVFSSEEFTVQETFSSEDGVIEW